MTAITYADIVRMRDKLLENPVQRWLSFPGFDVFVMRDSARVLRWGPSGEVGTGECVAEIALPQTDDLDARMKPLRELVERLCGPTGFEQAPS